MIMKDRNLVWIIGLLTLVINIAAGLCNYYFVTRHQAELDKKQIDKIQQELKNLPAKDTLQIKYLEKSIEKLEKDMAILDSKSERILAKLSITEKQKSINVMERENIKNIQPALHREVSLYYSSEDTIAFKVNIKNIGKYPVTVNSNLYLSINEIKPNQKIRNRLIPGKDYIVGKLDMNNLAPEEDCPSIQYIKLVKPESIPNIIYYFVEFDVKTDSEIIRSVTDSRISRNKIEELSQKHYYSYGNIIKLK